MVTPIIRKKSDFLSHYLCTLWKTQNFSLTSSNIFRDVIPSYCRGMLCHENFSFVYSMYNQKLFIIIKKLILQNVCTKMWQFLQSTNVAKEITYQMSKSITSVICYHPGQTKFAQKYNWCSKMKALKLKVKFKLILHFL